MGDEFSAIETPALAGLFATYLRNKGASVAIVDAPAENLSPVGTCVLVGDTLNHGNPFEIRFQIDGIPVRA